MTYISVYRDSFRESVLELLTRVCFSLIYAVALSYIYIYQVQPSFEYMGFSINYNINELYVLISCLFSVFPSLLFLSRLRLPSAIFSFVVYYLVYIPSIMLSYLSGFLAEFDSFVLNLTLLLSMFIIIILPKYVKVRIEEVKFSRKSYTIFLLLVFFICLFVLFVFYKPNLVSLLSLQSMSNLYDIRGDFREISRDVPTIARYVFSWISKIIVPLLLVYGLAKENKFIVLSAVIIALLLFSSTGLKSIFLGPIITFLLWKFFRNRGISFKFASFAAMSLLISGIAFSSAGSDSLNFLLIRRIAVVPGILTGYYYDFFSNNEFTFLGHSVLSSFVSYPYEHTPPFLIGEYYFGRSDMSANANFLASAYADFGKFGCIFFASMASIMFGIIDRIAEIKGAVREVTSVIFLPSWALIDTAFFTTLLTHGLLPIIVILYFLPSNFFVRNRTS